MQVGEVDHLSPAHLLPQMYCEFLTGGCCLASYLPLYIAQLLNLWLCQHQKHTHMYMHSPTQACTHTPTHIHTCMNLCTHTHSHRHAHMRAAITMVDLQATLHAQLGSWLERQQHLHQMPILASPMAHPAPVLFFGRAAVSFGALAVVLAVGSVLCTLKGLANKKDKNCSWHGEDTCILPWRHPLGMGWHRGCIGETKG